ncbi:MAG TPA: helix-turn-helix domain-containing protein [Streptosporangiaceae bacterium]|nr:helix-turn-helix domain-containing protein [Streptosporangiaceae bacterium]
MTRGSPKLATSVLADLHQPRTLARLFPAEFGVTFPQWRTNIRVFHATIELAAGANVTETGRRCGWATASAFIDTFRHAIGETPGSYQSAITAASWAASRQLRRR